MKKYNTVNSRWFLYGIMLPILLFFLCLDFAYSYFTSAIDPINESSSTGILKIRTTGTTVSPSNPSVIMPGDTINFTTTIANDGEVAMYILLNFNIEIALPNSTTEIINEYYTFSNSNLVKLSSLQTNTVSAFDLLVNESKTVSITYNFDGDTYGKDYENVQVSCKLKAFGIQISNLNPTQAGNEIIKRFI